MLISSLGLLETPAELAMIVAVVVLTVVGWTINRALGTPERSQRSRSGPALDVPTGRSPIKLL